MYQLDYVCLESMQETEESLLRLHDCQRLGGPSTFPEFPFQLATPSLAGKDHGKTGNYSLGRVTIRLPFGFIMTSVASFVLHKKGGHTFKYIVTKGRYNS